MALMSTLPGILVMGMVIALCALVMRSLLTEP